MSHNRKGEDDVGWPLFGKISVGVEGFIYYSQFSCKVIIHDLSNWFPSANIHSNIQHTIMLMSGILSFAMGYIADDLLGKYRVVMGVYLLSTMSPVIGLIAIYYPDKSSEWRTKMFICSIYFWFPIFGAEAARVALISEQFKLPQSLRNLKVFYFCFFLSRYAGSGVAGLLMKMEQFFGGNLTQLTVRVSLLTIVITCYTILLLALRSQIRRKRVQAGVVDSVVACVFSALFNKAFARKKMPANSKWIDYSDAKYYKETKDSAVQLVQMSLIFLPFSLFFGLNEFLDVIWMEQNEWIDQDEYAFVSSLSLITMYHTVDVILIPLFEYLVEFYAPRKCNLVITDLQLIGTAIFLLGLTYLSTTIFQSKIENGNIPANPTSASVRFHNAYGGNVTITTPYGPTVIISVGDSFEIANVKPQGPTDSPRKVTFPAKISYGSGQLSQDYVMLEASVGSITTYIVSDDGLIRVPPMKVPSGAIPAVDIVNGIPQTNFGEIRLSIIKSHASHHHGGVTSGHDNYKYPIPPITEITRLEVVKGDWLAQLYIQNTLYAERNVSLLPRSIYTIFICYDTDDRVTMRFSTTNTAQNVRIWFALPQILLRSLADGIGKIATYYFTYTQSPRKLRATAFGVLFFAQYSFPGIIGFVSSFWKQGLSSFILSLYTFIVFLALVLFIYFSLKYEEI